MPPIASPSRPTDVYFFGTCLLDLFLPEAGLDAITLLEREGLRVHFPQGQSCCGQPAYTSGQPAEARSVARAQLGLFPQPWPIVVPSGSCAGMMHRHWPTLFADTPDHAQAVAVAGRVVEFADFLLNVLQFARRDHGDPTQVAVHTSCSARREMGTHLASEALVEQLDNVTRVSPAREAECCGFGGAFALRHPDISGAMVSDKAAALQASGATTFVTADAGCLMNINGKLGCGTQPFAGQHLASFLLHRTGDLA